MEFNDFLKNFADQFEDIDVNTLKAETEFKSIEGWSSLVALSVIAMADEEYDVTLKGDDIKKSTTIKDLYEIVKSRA